MNRFNQEIRIQNLKFVVTTHKQGHIYANWTRAANALICVQEGAIRIESGAETALLHEWDCVFIPAGASGSTYFVGDSNTTFIFLFDLPAEERERNMIRFEKCHGVATVMRSIMTAYAEGVVNIHFYFSALYRLIYTLQENRRIPQKYEKIHALVLEIERCYYVDLKVSTYAKSAFMSESNLRRLFKEYTGKSIIDYRNDVRLKRAAEWILSGMSVGEASAKVGFSSPSYYCRLVAKKRKNL